MRLPGFPVPVLGETFSSVVSRHLARSATPKTRNLGLLGLRITAASSLVPNDLQTFVSAMPQGHPWADDPKAIVLGHTLVPLYLYFAHPERYETTIDRICASRTMNPAATLGLTITMPKRLQVEKFCPECVAQDMATQGFSSLYRQHQPTFVKVCAAHARPLCLNCIRCQSSRNAASMWRMAGHCNCNNPLTPPTLGTGLDIKTEGAWLWLSQQVNSILTVTNPRPSISHASNLFSALQEYGFAASRWGFNTAALASALVERFGTMFLRELGIEVWCDPKPGGRRPSRVLTRSAIEGKRIPNVLHALLLARLITDDISTFLNKAPVSRVQEQRPPSGYSRRQSKSRQILDKRMIISALKAANGKITVAAQKLGVSSFVLAADIRHHEIRLPLPPFTAKRLGLQLVDAVRRALREGIPKSEIEHSLGVSEWSIVLIELDTPELFNIHREATIARQRRKHQDALIEFRQQYPDASRSQFAKNNASAFDWLRKFDREWLDANLPAPHRASGKSTRQSRKNWQQLDQKAVEVVQEIARDELAKDSRPTRLTRTRLLYAAGALVALGKNARGRYPMALAKAQHLSESKDVFLRRTIRWALQEYAKLHVPISTNLLRRVARLPPAQLIEHRAYVIKVARELQLPFDTRCSLSPWRKPKKIEPTLPQL